MKNTKLSFRLWALSGFLILVIAVSAAVNHVKARELMASLDNVSGTQLPAVRTMTLVDMMHDGLRAVVMTSYVSANENDAEGLKENLAEVAEFSEKIKTYLHEIQSLAIAPETKKLIQDSTPELNAYVASANEMVGIAAHHDIQEFRQKLPTFNGAFKNLEEKLEVLGARIEADAGQIRDGGKDILRVSAAIAFGGIALALLMTFFLVRALVRDFTAVTNKISDTSSVVDGVARQLEDASQKLSACTTQAAAALQETAAGIEQTTAMIGKNAANAELSCELSHKSTETVNRGKNVLDQMIGSIDEIAVSNAEIMAQVNESNQQISTVINVIREIGTKTKVINEIVFQTKLLSFNASVEAARAGEQGKGFAVVAEEVGNLAQMSGNSAQEITDLLDQSIKKVEAIIGQTNEKVQGLIHKGTAKIENGTKMARMCEEVFNEIVDHTSQSGGVVEQIADASREQSKGIEEINKAVAEIDQVSQQNNSISQEAAQSATDLKDQVAHLQDMVLVLRKIVQGQEAARNDKRAA